MKKDISFLLSLFKKYWVLLFLAIAGSLLESGALAGLAYIVKNIVDDVFVSKSYESLVFVTAVLIILASAKQIGFFLKNYVYPLIVYKGIKNIRENIYGKLLNTQPSFLFKHSYGDILSRLTNDLERFSQIVTSFGTNVITETFTVMAIIVLLIYRDWKMFLIFLVAVPFLTVALGFFGEKRKKYSKKLQESYGDYTQHLNQLLTGFEVVKLFSQKVFFKIFRIINENLYHREKKNKFYETVYLSSVEIIAYTATAGIIFYGGYRIINEEITAGDFFSFLGGVLILVNSMQVLQRGLVQLKALSPVIERIKFLLDMPEEKDEGIEFEGLKDRIVYKNVSLKIDNNQILKDVNLKINKGEKLGIVGLTGSGKSTVVKILPGLIKDYEGNVFIDDHELREYSVSSLRKHIGVISQDVFIFNDTLRNNLLIAKPDATDEELYQALKKAKADFVFSMENGLDTVLGEKGSRLSGGERQRISIARIFLKDPDILIIDEGTSALDVETEEYVMEEIKEHFSDRTVIMITHRLKILDICDRIAVMDKGTVVEEGTKKELLEKKGIFYRFFSLSQTDDKI
ncbi:MAG TPA: ABC transporter ATP-binding protein [Persephonella sp.]|uniref:ABC transporter n=1 Tax=Persephonella marina (strain DSM 14350 / EX-H1) TaxID=123214 RepID=C0QU71_PERMH|nr:MULTISPECIES: ABC transporter ATP-binding protein [Persephonella]ACO04204.1 ABC transporter [Persephonella marina EX-H1]HCB70148.1 ABC transporter ATP-binding protein [Persephonella sp.]